MSSSTSFSLLFVFLTAPRHNRLLVVGIHTHKTLLPVKRMKKYRRMSHIEDNVAKHEEYYVLYRMITVQGVRRMSKKIVCIRFYGPNNKSSFYKQ